MTHDRAISLGLVLVDHGFDVSVTLVPETKPTVLDQVGEISPAHVAVTMTRIGRAVTLQDTINLAHVLAEHGAHGALIADGTVRVVDRSAP